ncbi:MAG: hypothetical protein HKP58_06960 [Desulfatitalea sp.]|nr:right-handed parallel beta-helix repeat-containing protein [Desulfatitalea sp.]NNK00136.1 hypothetical protein [Desulfatitalea sp.]
MNIFKSSKFITAVIIYLIIPQFPADVQAAQGIQLYVSTQGNDQWSGRLAAPNASLSDGPVASITKARDLIRGLKCENDPIGPVTVWIRGGTYYVNRAIQFLRQDSGTQDAPIVYRAYPGETPMMVGGRRITGFTNLKNGWVSVTLPEVKNGDWFFRQLFVDGQRQIRARYPNFDPSDPHRAGFLYTARCPKSAGRKIGMLGADGNWFEYNILIPKTGTYQVWVNYAHKLAERVGAMDDRVALSIDGSAPIPLSGLPVTGDWKTKFEWRLSASTTLTAGRRRLRWLFLKNTTGVMGLGALLLSSDSKWRPGDLSLAAIQDSTQNAFVHAESFEDFNGSFFLFDGPSNRHIFCYDPGDAQVIEDFSVNSEEEVHIFPSGDCRAYNEIVRLDKVDPSKQSIRISGEGCTADIGIGDRYHLENSYEFLDAPGEWFLDKSSGKLFYYPIKAFSAATEVIAPVNARLLEFIGSIKEPIGHIQIEGLLFSGSDPSSDDECIGFKICRNAMIVFTNAVGCRVESCTFRNIGKNAMYIEGGKNNSIIGNTIVQGAEGGIVLEDSWANTISDNHISNLGAVYKNIGAITLTGRQCSQNTIQHNEIHDISRYGITLKQAGQLNAILCNRISTTNTETYDTGAIEVTQSDAIISSNSIIRNNILTDTIGYSHNGKRAIFSSWGIYLDSFASGYTVENNLVYGSAHGAMFIQGGKNNRIRNNIFAEANDAVVFIANFKGASSGLLFENNIVYSTRSNSKLLTTNQLSENTLRAENNLYYAGDNTIAIIQASGIGGLEAWKKNGYDQNALLSDPMFINPAKGDFSLAENSKAFSIGFAEIDFSSVGIRPHALLMKPRGLKVVNIVPVTIPSSLF